MDLKEMLGEELFAQVTEKLGDNKLATYTGDFAPVPYDRFKDTNDTKKLYKENVDTLQTQLEKLKGMEDVGMTKAEIATMTEQLGQLQADLSAKDLQIANGKKSAYMESQLGKAKLKENYKALVSKQFELDKIEFDEAGESAYVSELIKNMQESNKEMFGETVLVGNAIVGDKDKEKVDIEAEAFRERFLNA